MPTSPAGGTTVQLAEDSGTQVTLSGGAQVSLYGVPYTRFWIADNGYLTFQSPSSDYTETVAEHFAQPRISMFYDDLSPVSGQVTRRQLADRMVVTYLAVAEYGTTNTVTMQTEMFFDGRITVSYLAVGAQDCVAGLSRGGGLSPDYLPTDLSSFGDCYCPADVNHDGTISVQDIFDFLTDYFLNDDAADFNGVGGVTVQDIFDFLAAYFSGCP